MLGIVGLLQLLSGVRESRGWAGLEVSLEA